MVSILYRSLHVDIGDYLVLRVVEFCCEKPELS